MEAAEAVHVVTVEDTLCSDAASEREVAAIEADLLEAPATEACARTRALRRVRTSDRRSLTPNARELAAIHDRKSEVPLRERRARIRPCARVRFAVLNIHRHNEAATLREVAAVQRVPA